MVKDNGVLMSTFKQIIERTNDLLKLFDQHTRIINYSRE